MYHHSRTPLRVPIVAIFITLFAMLLFGGASYATDEESLQSAAAQSANITTEAQSSSDIVATATTTDNGLASCTPQDISPGEIDTALKTSDGSSDYTAYEAVEFSISLTLEEGHCASDSTVVTVPSELGTDTNFTPIPMETPDGVIIGYATYSSDHTVVIKLTSEVEVPGRKDFRASAWWRVHMSSTLVPGETRELRWDIDGVVRRTTIHVGTCDGCSQVGKDPSKWGSADREQQHITIVLPTATQDDQTFVITDVLTSPGQKFICNDLLTGRIGVYSEAGPWGQPQYTRFMEANVVSCASDKAVLNVKLDKGEKARFELRVAIESTDPGPWTDVANITSQDKSWDVSARIIRRESGGNAGFDTNPVVPTPTPSPEPTPEPSPVPTPSTSPTPAPSPTPSPTPSVTPAPSPTPEPTPSTPSVTPEPTPSPTPSTSPSPAPTPSVTPKPEPSPTPKPAQRQPRLPVTGVTGTAAASAIALATIGGFILWARRRVARPE